MLRTVMVLIVGALLGALLFHLYYLGLSQADRCGWDHPMTDSARAACREAVARPQGFEGYGKRARHDLDDLVGQVSH